MISTDMLAAFVRVAEHLSVTAAAADLGIGKSIVSKRIAQLEAALATTLFSRSTRKVALTPAGDTYLGFARRALDEVSRGEERLRDQRVDLTGLIRLTAPVSWGQHVLAKCLPEFLQLHPAIELELLLADRLMDVAHERIDIALRWTTATAPDMSSVPVASIDWVAVATAGYLAAAGMPAEPQDLTAHPCMCYWRENADDVWVFCAGTRREQVHARSRYRANNVEALADAALAGLGIALLPSYLCDDALHDGRLVRVLAGWSLDAKFGTRINAVATPERMRSSRNQVLLAFLRQRLAP